MKENSFAFLVENCAKYPERPNVVKICFKAKCGGRAFPTTTESRASYECPDEYKGKWIAPDYCFFHIL